MRRPDTDLIRIQQRIRFIDFDKPRDQCLAIIAETEVEITTVLKPRAQDEFMKHELDHLLRDLAQLRAIMEKEGALSYLERAICETVKNEILR